MQSYNKFFKFASVRVFFRKKIEFILLFYARRWLWMLAYGRHLGAYFFLLAFSFSSCSRSLFLPARVLSFLSSCSRSLFLPARVLFFFLLAFFLSSFYLAFRPARVLSFVLLSRVSFFLLAFFFFLLAFSFSSCSRSFFRPFISCSFFFLPSCSHSFFRPFISRSLFLPARVLFFFLLAFFLSSFYLAFLPARVLSFVLLSRVLFFFLLAFFFFRPARVLSFVLLSRVLSCSRSLFLPARIHFSQQIPLQNLHISKICCTFALKFKYTSTRLVEY